MSENPADAQTDLDSPTGREPAADLPSATVPGETVQPHGGAVQPEQSTDGSYNDGNLDERGVMPAAGRPQVDPDGEESLDDDLDTSLRTDGTGRPDEG
ncbi:hypothetical protein GCM10027446_08060 [Angustibacter peucedani]